jgi:four helix bundle protein
VESIADAKGDLKERTRDYAMRVIRLYSRLPQSQVAMVIGRQLLHCGTAVGASYRGGLRSATRPEFAAKLIVCLEELEEALYWLELLETARVFPADKLLGLKNETSELMSTIVSITKRFRSKRE